MPPFTSFLHQNVTFPFPYLLQSLYTNYSYLSTHIQQPILHTHPNTNSLLHYSRFYCTLTLLMWFTKVKNVKSLSFPIHFRIYVITFLPFRPKIADTEWFANTLFELTNFAVVIKEGCYMNYGKIVFAQIMQFIPRREFNDIVAKYKGNYRVRNLTC